MSKLSAKEKILEAALTRFLEDGYEASSVDDIIADAGVSKGSFYHAFKSKEALGLEALERYNQRGIEILSGGDYRFIEDPVDRALGFVRYTEENASQFWCHGCMLGNFAVGMAHKFPSFRTKLKQLFSSMETMLQIIFNPFAEAIGEGSPPGRELAKRYLNSLYGAIVMGQAHGDPRHTADGIAMFRHYLESLAR